MRVRNASAAPFIGRTRIEAGEVGEVDINRPGVRGLLTVGHLVALDEVDAPASDGEALADVRDSLKAARSRVAELEAEAGALRAANDAHAQSDRPRVRLPSRDENEAAQMRAQFDRAYGELQERLVGAEGRIADLARSNAEADAAALARFEDVSAQLVARENELAAARARIAELEVAAAAPATPPAEPAPADATSTGKKSKKSDATAEG